MAVINTRYRYLFLAEKRCASRVLSDVLAAQPGSEIVLPHHATFDEVDDKCPISQEYTICSIVRNPADILVTMQLANSFQDYMRLAGCNPSRVFFQHESDIVLRYENLENDLNTLLRSLKAPEVTIPYKEKYVTGLKNPWPSYYEERDIDFILGTFPEIERWGYIDIIRPEWKKWQLQMTNGTSSS